MEQEKDVSVPAFYNESMVNLRHEADKIKKRNQIAAGLKKSVSERTGFLLFVTGHRDAQRFYCCLLSLSLHKHLISVQRDVTSLTAFVIREMDIPANCACQPESYLTMDAPMDIVACRTPAW